MKILTTLIIIFVIGGANIFAQTTALTYQGRLTDNSAAASGTYQMRFSLFDSDTGGTQSGTTIELTNVSVSNGVFTVELNFGTAPFPFGAARYLQIEVRRNSGEIYATLTPRQQVTTTPYSIRSLEANSANNSMQLGGVAANQYVQTNDSRLSDARTPTAGSSNYIQNTTTQQTANFNVSGTGTGNIFNAGTQFNLNNSRILSSPGILNTFVGIGNGNANTSGERNTFIGRNTGINNTTGSTNTFVGSGAGFENINGSDNSFFGYNAGLRVTSGTKNSFFGVSAGSANLTSGNNSFFGYESGLKTTAADNSFFGISSGKENTSGFSNSYFGAQAGSKITAGFYNSFFGTLAGSESTTGNNNSFFGVQAGQKNVANFNSFFGSSTGFNNSTGYENAFFGYNAGLTNTIGYYNVMIGSVAGFYNTSGSFNIFAGRSAGVANSTGAGNAFFGYNAGFSNDTGNFNTLIGFSTDVGSDNLSNATAIGASAVVTSSNTIQLGRNNFDEVRIGKLAAATSTNLCINSNNVIAACSSSIRYKENVADFRPGLSILNKLRPVSFNWRGEGTLDFGLVAEEVAEVEPLLTTTNEKGEIQGVKYDRIGVVLINVVKEQQTQIKNQQKQIDELRQIVCLIKPDAEVCQEENQ